MPARSCAIAALTLSTVFPPTGPLDGGIKLNVSGGGLVGGSLYRCCVAAEAAPCEPDGLSVTAAAYDAASGVVMCTCPQVFNGEGAYQVRASLNKCDHAMPIATTACIVIACSPAHVHVQW